MDNTLRKLLEKTKPLVTEKLAAQAAAEKRSFVDTGMLGGGAPPGGDPAAAGGMPPGGDPAAAGGGAPPADPMAGGGGGGLDPMTLQPMIQQAVQMAMSGMGGGGGAGGGAGGGIKPKIDVNVTLLQILKILARIADALNVQIPASEMVATQGDLNSFAGQQAAGQSAPTGGDAAGGAGGAPPAIPPIDPMQAATKSGADFGVAYPDGGSMTDMASEASAIADILDALGD
jgi:hypothetical protein